MRVFKFGSVVILCGLLACGDRKPDHPQPGSAQDGEEAGAAQPKTIDPHEEIEATLANGIARSGCKVLAALAGRVKREQGQFPATKEHLLTAAVVELLKQKGVPDVASDLDDAGIRDVVRNDPWDHPYVYEVLDDHVKVTSAGPDGKLGTEDDLSATSK